MCAYESLEISLSNCLKVVMIIYSFEDFWMLEDCLFCTHETVKSQKTFLKANGVSIDFTLLNEYVTNWWKVT